MVRPQKNGLDYFPLDTIADYDDKFQLLEAKYGVVGFAVIIKLIMKIYNEGYFYSWGEKESLLHSKRVNVNSNEVNAMVEDAVKWGIFNSCLYKKYNILTSNGIQKRFWEVAKRRTEVTIDKRFWVYNVNDIIVSANINLTNVNAGTQRKVKDSTVKDSTANIPEIDFDMFWAAYPKKKNKGNAEKAWDKIKKDMVLCNIIMDKLFIAKKTIDWTKESGKYIPHPATWLNAKGWQDEDNITGTAPPQKVGPITVVKKVW